MTNETAEIGEVVTELRYASISQRARGVYLLHCVEDRYGTDDWDAFSTVAAAKRRAAEWFERSSLPWRHEPSTPTTYEVWQVTGERDLGWYDDNYGWVDADEPRWRWNDAAS